MEFLVLGPVELRDGGRSLGPPVRPQQNLVLAALLVDTDRPVPIDQLVDRVWGEEAPENARRTLHTHVARIRRLLGRDDRPGSARLTRHAGGYHLVVDPQQVDLHRFRQLVDRARDIRDSPEEGVVLWRQALALWRGEALAGLAGDWAARTRQRLQTSLVDATVAWADVELLVGRPEVVIDRLGQVVDDHPLLEKPVAVLMRALAADGRTSEALEQFAATRRRLADELGTDPGAELSALHTALLREALAPAAPARPPAAVPEFRLLGPLEVIRAGRPVPIRAGKHRALLAALLLRTGRSVPLGELVDIVWGERSPAKPRSTIQIYVNRLRATLGDVIETTFDGYRIAARVTDVDLGRFEELLAGAASHGERGDLRGEAEALHEALALWRGEPLADVPSATLHREVTPHLREQRMRALERRIDVDLRRGRHAELTGELMALTAQHPLRERLWAQLMTAYHHGGRQADALAAYRTVRDRLADELGIAPGPGLQEIHAAVLADRPTPDADRPTALPRVPRQLPPAPHRFTGRAREVARLDALLRDSGQDAAEPPLIGAVTGTAGVGKSALAAHWGHRVAGEFPDGQLWVNLRGHGPGRTMPPEQALAVLLRGLGVAGTEIPMEPEARAGLYRSLLAGRRMLIVLDNAGSPAQVRPLLPGAPGCFVLLTSRDDMTGLVVRDGAIRVPLDLLPRPESVSLLRQLLGPEAVDDHPEAVEELVRLCARLPLALRIAADRVAGGSMPLPDAVKDLARGRRLDAFAAGGDPHTAVRAVFSWSYEALPPAAARLFRLLGLVPGDDWDAPAAAALADHPLAAVKPLLGVLTSAHLIEPSRDRYAMHDLLRAYAVELVDREPGREPAWHRLCRHYLAMSDAAAERVFPAELGLPRPPADPVGFGTAEEAVSWLDANRVSVVATCRRAAETGPPEVAWQLADVLRAYLFQNRHTADARTVVDAGRTAARKAGDVRAEAMMTYALGTLCGLTVDLAGARQHYQTALDLFGQVDDRDGQVAATVGLGSAYADLGELTQARALLSEAVVGARRQGLADVTGIALATLFTLHHSEGELHAAADCITEALDLFRARANNQRVIPMLINRAVSMRLIGRYDEALRDVTEGLALARKAGMRHYEASANVVLALTALDSRRPDLAFDHATQGLQLILAAGLKEYETAARTALGWVHWVRGEDALAIECHSRCLQIAQETGFVLSELQGHIGLAGGHYRLGDVETALDHARQALAGAQERRFRLTECQAAQLLALIATDRGDLSAHREHMARADQIKRDTGYLPSWYMPAPDPAGTAAPGPAPDLGRPAKASRKRAEDKAS